MKAGIIPQTEVLNFITAGKATFTIKNIATEGRYTYKVTTPPDKNKDQTGLLWVSVMMGSDNETSYKYIGCLRKHYQTNIWSFAHSTNSKLSAVLPCVVGFTRIFNQIWAIGKIDERLEFWHAGRCCRCGEKLTVPESIASGIGPICAKRKLRVNK